MNFLRPTASNTMNAICHQIFMSIQDLSYVLQAHKPNYIVVVCSYIYTKQVKFSMSM